VFDYIPFPVLTHTTGMTHFQVTNTQSGRRSSATTHSPTSPVQVRTEVSIRGYNFS